MKILMVEIDHITLLTNLKLWMLWGLDSSHS